MFNNSSTLTQLELQILKDVGLDTNSLTLQDEIAILLSSQNTQKKHINLGFKVFKTIPIWEDYEFVADSQEEDQVLFDSNQLTTDDLENLLLTWKTSDGIELTQNLVNIDFGGYIGRYYGNKLYLVDKGFTTDNLTKLIELIDSNQNFNPTVIIVFGYNFQSKNLREIAENIKNYSNKKGSEIDFITRY